MAIDAHAVAEHAAKPKPNQKPQETPVDGNKGAVKFRRNLFVNETGTGVVVTDRNRKGENLRPQEVTFSPELRQQYTNFLSNYIQRLSEVRRQDPALLLNENHRHDDELLSRMTSPSGDLDKERIDKFLEKPEGWMITTQLLEHQTSLELYAMALKASLRPRGERQMGLMDIQPVSMGDDEGGLHRLVFNRVTPILNRVANQVDGRTDVNYRDARQWHVLGVNLASVPVVGIPFAALSTVAGFGPLPGMALGSAVAPGLTMLARTLREGTQIDIHRVGSVFNVIKNSPQEAEYTRKMFGIDVRDLQIDAITGQVVQAPRIAETQDEQGILQNGILEKLYTRFEFYNQLGVPRNRLDALPEQFLYDIPPPPNQVPGFPRASRVHEPRPEQMRVKFESRVMEIFNPNAGAGLNPADVEGNISRYMKARREAMMEMVTDMTRREIEKRNATRPTATIDAQIKKREGEDYKKERGKQFVDREKVHVEDRALLKTENGKLTPYQDALKKHRDARTEAQQKFGVDSVVAIDAAIQTRRAGLTDPAVAGAYAQQLSVLVTARNAEVAIREGGIPATFTGKARENELYTRIKDVNEKFEDQKKDLKERVYDEVMSEVVELRGLKVTIQTQEKTLAPTEKVVTEAQVQIGSLEADFSFVTGIDTALTGAGLAPVGLTENDLRTLPMDELITRINTANTNGAGNVPPVVTGWPDTQNKRPENRTRLLRAVVEARARGAEAADATRAARLPDHTALRDATTWNLSDNELLWRTPAQITAELTARQVANPTVLGPLTVPSVAQIDNAVTEAQSRIRVRTEAFGRQDAVLGDQIRDQAEGLNAISFDQEVRQLETTKELLQRERNIFDHIQEVSAEPARFTNIAIVPTVATDPAYSTYTDSERTAGYARGYYEIADLLFDYRQKADRNSYFGKIQQVLPPDKLAVILNDSLGLGIVGVNMDAVLTVMATQLGNGQLSSMEIYPGFRATLDRLQGEALALS